MPICTMPRWVMAKISGPLANSPAPNSSQVKRPSVCSASMSASTWRLPPKDDEALGQTAWTRQLTSPLAMAGPISAGAASAAAPPPARRARRLVLKVSVMSSSGAR